MTIENLFKFQFTDSICLSKFYLFIILLTTTCNYCYPQKYTVLDSITQKPISFATIKYNNSEKGIYSNEKGVFFLDNEISDSITISSMGYNTIKLNILHLKDSIYLNPKVEDLKEVVINNRFNEKVIGSNRRESSYSWHLSPSWELNTYLKFNEDYYNKYIKEIHFPVSKAKNIKDKSLNAIVRMNIYLADNGMVGEKIYTSNTVNCKINKSSTLSFNVFDQMIKINSDGLFVGIELIGLITEKGETQGAEKGFLNLSFTKKNAKEFESKTYFKLVFSDKTKWMSISEFRKKYRDSNKKYYLPIGLTLVQYEN